MRPRIALTLGDVAGIGPEVVVRACCVPAMHDWCQPVVVGHPQVLQRAIDLTGSALQVQAVDRIDEGDSTPASIVCWNPTDDQAAGVSPGQIDGRAGQAACEYLSAATEAALAGRIDAITTAPLSKAALHRAGLHYPGHTEILAELCGVREYAMMLYLGGQGSGVGGRGSGERLGVGAAGDEASAVRGIFYSEDPAVGVQSAIGATQDAAPNSRLPLRRLPTSSLTLQVSSLTASAALGVVHVTLHTSLRSVPELLTREGIREKIRLIDRFLRDVGCGSPRIGVCALNPHAGEEGLFGDEERTVIAPAVRDAVAEKIDAIGPLPADTLIKRAVGGEFDGVVAMYHDQGHIALKLIGFNQAVNVTLGLPIVRTSPSHGTAFDIAWQGKASGAGMVEAVRVAALLADRKGEARKGKCERESGR